MTRREFILKTSVPFLVAACSKGENDGLPNEILELDVTNGASQVPTDYVCTGATLQCNYGMAPSMLLVADPQRPMVNGAFLANIMDNVPLVNILPFGMCLSKHNPMVVAATEAANGVLTPQSCIPTIAEPWRPAGEQLVGNRPALTEASRLNCLMGGQITIKSPTPFPKGEAETE